MANRCRRRKAPWRWSRGWAAAAAACVVAAAPCIAAQTKAEPSPEPQAAGLARLRAASRAPVEVQFHRGFPRSVRASVPVEGASPVERAGAFLRQYADLYGQAHPQLGLEVQRIGRTALESVHYVQTLGGVPVFGAGLVVFLEGNSVTGTAGSLLTTVQPGRRGVTITARQAESAARAHMRDAGAPLLGVTSLAVFDQGLLQREHASSPALTWRVALGGRVPAQVFVDARSGAVRWSFTTSETGYDMVLADANGTNGADTDCYWYTDAEVYVGSENGVVAAYVNDPDAGSAWWGAQDTYNFYSGTFGRDSYDDDGGQMQIAIYAGVPNARWLSNCDIAEFTMGWPKLDILAHEFTHAVTQYESDLVYAFQSGALNESYSDVMAALADGNWTIGEGVPGGAIRDMSNPSDPAYNHPDIMSNWVPLPSINDNGGVHTNSGIPNKAHYLMAAGGFHNGRNVMGMGGPSMGWVAYGTLQNLWSGAQFIDARNVSVQVVSSYVGQGSWTVAQVCTVRNAWAAVGIGNGDADCDGTEDNQETDNDNDGIADGPDNCNFISNPTQTDTDGDELGDACDPDADGDNLVNGSDNCPFVANANQADSDNDGKGNACDDDDWDGVLDINDNCPTTSNWDQADQDGDGKGDLCDPDIDGDGVLNGPDNCDTDYNPNQQDTDGGGWGDVCDPNPNSPIDELAFKIGLKLSNLALQQKPIPIPIGPCKCPDRLLDPEYRQEVIVEGLPQGARAWLADAQGEVVHNVAFGDGGPKTLRFTPRGGQPLYLNLALSPKLAGQTVEVSATLVEKAAQ